MQLRGDINHYFLMVLLAPVARLFPSGVGLRMVPIAHISHLLLAHGWPRPRQHTCAYMETIPEIDY